MQERVIPIASGAGDGPGDEGCADLLVTTLTGHKGIDAVAFDPKQHAFRIRYDPDLVSLATVERLADQVGVQLGERYQRCVYHMDGVTCRNCGRAIERQLKRDPRIIWASANPPSGSLALEYADSRTQLPTISRPVARQNRAEPP